MHTVLQALIVSECILPRPADYLLQYISARLRFKDLEVLSPDLYRCVITCFDGLLTRPAGLSIGDELRVESQHFFAHWTPGQTREDGEGAQKVYENGSTRRPMPIPGSSEYIESKRRERDGLTSNLPSPIARQSLFSPAKCRQFLSTLFCG